MTAVIAYPPLPSEKGVPLLSQNRQFQWFNTPTFIYPVVPATAATMARDAGFAVDWLDGIAEQLTPEQFDARLVACAPDVVMMETKTPVVKAHWQILARLKKLLPQTRFVLVGDHVTAMPEESFENSPVDFVLTGGDYDFLFLNLLRHLENNEALEPGVWFRDASGAVKNTGRFQLDHDLRTLPHIDRELTKWRLYSEKNGNFRKLPGTYVMAGRDCWHGRCTFCSWTTLYPAYRAREPLDVVDEIGRLIDMGVREIMDDTGCFPVGEWLENFCNLMIARGYNRRVRLDCNMRFGRLTPDDYKLMRKAGFRFVLFGLESANQSTLDRLDKALKVQEILDGARWASQAGLDVHVTVMLGYPWETREDVANTVRLARGLLRRGHAYTLQVTHVIPYPGTPLFRECRENGTLLTHDWDAYDMRGPVMASPLSACETQSAIRSIYRAFLHPETLLRRLLSTRHPLDDLRFYWRGFKSLAGHLRDFKAAN